MSGILAMRNLSVRYGTPQGDVHALRRVDLDARPGEVIGIVGESGCGKSTLVTALANLLPANARAQGSIAYGGVELVGLDACRQRLLRGDEIALVGQDPMTAFNPVLTIGDQLLDFQHHRRDLGRARKKARIAEMLARVGISDAERRMASYPHELSGGMRQRVAIAAALLADPGLLIADEPTTALDVTTEAQIIQLLCGLRRDYNGIVILVSHHLGVIAELCDRVYVMYAGEVVEAGEVDTIFHAARHPYTQALLACDPARFHDRLELLPTIPGTLPNLMAPPAGCVYAPRCDRCFEPCLGAVPPVARLSRGHVVRCHGVTAT
jgi:oligopeptide/dipeptide ABC transporter ATP-binding protein